MCAPQNNLISRNHKRYYRVSGLDWVLLKTSNSSWILVSPIHFNRPPQVGPIPLALPREEEVIVIHSRHNLDTEAHEQMTADDDDDDADGKWKPDRKRRRCYFVFPKIYQRILFLPFRASNFNLSRALCFRIFPGRCLYRQFPSILLIPPHSVVLRLSYN